MLFFSMHLIEELSDCESDCESDWDHFLHVMYSLLLLSPARQVPLKIIVGRQFVMSVPQKCALWKDWWDYLKKDEPPLKLQVKDIICKVEIVVLRAIAKQVAIDSWCWCHDREVYCPQPRIDNDILVPIDDKLS